MTDGRDLDGKLVLVTGASSGIGRATAELFARRGARVLLTARSAEKLAKMAAGIAEAGGTAFSHPADLSDPDAIATMAAAILAERGVPDLVVNNAGAGRWKPLAETTAEEAQAMIALPYLAAFSVTRAFLPAMLARGSGRVAFVTSPASFIVWPNASAYVAARFALRGFAEALRADLRGKPVGVTLVTLGLVGSTYWEHNPGSREYMPPYARLLRELTPEEAAETIVSAVLRGKSSVVRPWILRLVFALGLSA
jgi:uncharacterized protein